LIFNRFLIYRSIFILELEFFKLKDINKLYTNLNSSNDLIQLFSRYSLNNSISLFLTVKNRCFKSVLSTITIFLIIFCFSCSGFFVLSFDFPKLIKFLKKFLTPFLGLVWSVVWALHSLLFDSKYDSSSSSSSSSLVLVSFNSFRWFLEVPNSFVEFDPVLYLNFYFY